MNESKTISYPYVVTVNIAYYFVKNNIHPQIITLFIFKLNITTASTLLTSLPEELRQDILINRIPKLNVSLDLVSNVGEVIVRNVNKYIEEYVDIFGGKDIDIPIAKDSLKLIEGYKKILKEILNERIIKSIKQEV
jgi:hypothetical protein